MKTWQAVVVMLLATSAGFAAVLLAPRDVSTFESRLHDCRHRCVSHAAEAFQYGDHTGCTCVGQLP